jgi:transcriptional regulator with XRE-family HTH domain
MILGPRIAAARKSKGLTQKELAERLDLATGTIQQYELGKRRPDVDVLKSIANIMDVSVDSLVRTDEPDDEYEMICGTLNSAGYSVDQGIMADEFYIAPLDAPDDPETRRKIKYPRLAETVLEVLTDAEKKKKEYIKKRLEAELFGWKL